MNRQRVVDVLLAVLLLVGLLMALRVSWWHVTGRACPTIGNVPICLVVAAAYASMLLALVLRSFGGRHYVFAIGWCIAFLFAAIGSAVEYFGGGGACPVSGGGGLRGATVSPGIPMCYVSLVLVIAILVLFLAGPYRRACDLHNAHLPSTDGS